jgi:hypothetical protein
VGHSTGNLLTHFFATSYCRAADPAIALLGGMQSLFEASLYSFVFLWTLSVQPRNLALTVFVTDVTASCPLFCVVDPAIALLGGMQSLFEASMYSFVFLWTLAMSPNKEGIKHGLIFVNFMTACMAGSFLAGEDAAGPLVLYVLVSLWCVVYRSPADCASRAFLLP